MRSSLLASLAAASLLVACGTVSDSDSDSEVDSSFLEAFPASANLALESDDNATDSDGAEAGDDLANGAAYSDSMMNEVASGEPTIVTINNLTCGVFTHASDVAELKLTACKLDLVFDYWAYRLEGRPAGLSDGLDTSADPAAELDGEANPVPPTADWLTLSAGKGRKLVGEYGGVWAAAGVVLYNFDGTRAIFGEGPTGKAAVGYRLTPGLRRVRIGQLNHSPDGVGMGVTARTGYIRVPGVGGLIAWTGLKDSLNNDNGTISLGEDGIRELGHGRFGWNSAGDGRSVAWVCHGSLGAGTCLRHAACYDATGTITYDVDTQEVTSDITWDEVACTPSAMPYEDEAEYVGEDADDTLDMTEPPDLD